MDTATCKATQLGTLILKRNEKLRDLHDCANKLQVIAHEARNLADAIDGSRPETERHPRLRAVDGQIQRFDFTSNTWIDVNPPDPEIAR